MTTTYHQTRHDGQEAALTSQQSLKGTLSFSMAFIDQGSEGTESHDSEVDGVENKVERQRAKNGKRDGVHEPFTLGTIAEGEDDLERDHGEIEDLETTVYLAENVRVRVGGRATVS
jgi:hypothetical protein